MVGQRCSIAGFLILVKSVSSDLSFDKNNMDYIMTAFNTSYILFNIDKVNVTSGYKLLQTVQCSFGKYLHTSNSVLNSFIDYKRQYFSRIVAGI